MDHLLNTGSHSQSDPYQQNAHSRNSHSQRKNYNLSNCSLLKPQPRNQSFDSSEPTYVYQTNSQVKIIKQISMDKQLNKDSDQ